MGAGLTWDGPRPPDKRGLAIGVYPPGWCPGPAMSSCVGCCRDSTRGQGLQLMRHQSAGRRHEGPPIPRESFAIRRRHFAPPSWARKVTRRRLKPPPEAAANSRSPWSRAHALSGGSNPHAVVAAKARAKSSPLSSSSHSIQRTCEGRHEPPPGSKWPRPSPLLPPAPQRCQRRRPLHSGGQLPNRWQRAERERRGRPSHHVVQPS